MILHVGIVPPGVSNHTSFITGYVEIVSITATGVSGSMEQLGKV